MMRYMNRRKNTLGILPLLATVLLSAASCTESVVQDMETDSRRQRGDTFFATHADTLRHRECGRPEHRRPVVQRVGQLPPHQRHGQRRADIRQHDRDLRFRYRLDLRRRPAVLAVGQHLRLLRPLSVHRNAGRCRVRRLHGRHLYRQELRRHERARPDDGGTNKYSNRGRQSPRICQLQILPSAHKAGLQYQGRGARCNGYFLQSERRDLQRRPYLECLRWKLVEQHRQDKRQRCPVGRKGYFHHSRRDPQHAGRRAVTPAHRPDWYRNRRELPFRGRDRRPEFHGQPLWRECETMGCRQPICLHPDRFGRFARNQREGSRLG